MAAQIHPLIPSEPIEPKPARDARWLRPLVPLATCGVCGSHEIDVDEVVERGVWRLSSCRRCENLWTDGPFGGPRAPQAARPRRARSRTQVAAA